MDNKGLDEQVQFFNDWIILLVLSGVELFVLIKLRFKIDFSGMLTLLIHFFVSLIRIIDDSIEIQNATNYIIFLIG